MALETGDRVVMTDGRHGTIIPLPETEEPGNVAVIADEDIPNLDCSEYYGTHDPTTLTAE